MRLYILAPSRDAKGTQLEYLTKTILKGLGYQFVSTNFIASGGDEIDVFAKMIIPTPGNKAEYPVLCECKAHDHPINENDWQKFLGKMFKQRSRNRMTQGIMIALSDANGNVRGDFDQSKYEGIQLLRGEDLIQSISKVFFLETESIAQEQVRQLTNETVISVDLVLFEKEIYWLFSFASGQYSLFNKNYLSLSGELANRIIPLIAKNTTFKPSSYKDVRKEFELVQRRRLIHSVLCWRLMKGRLSFEDGISDVVFLTKGGVKPSMKDVEEVVGTIPFAHVDYPSNTATIKDPSEIDYPSFYRSLLDNSIPVFLFDDYYMQHIDEDLINRICEIQYGLVLSGDDKARCLFILRHSPRALSYALTPDVLLKSCILMDKQISGNTSRNHFFERLSSFFEADAKEGGSTIVFGKAGLRDFQKSISLTLVDRTGEKQVISTNQRLFYAPTENGNWAIVEAVDGFTGEYDPETDRVVQKKT